MNVLVKLWSRLCEAISLSFSCNSRNGGLNFGFSLMQRSEIFHSSFIVSTLLYPLRLTGWWKSWPKLRFPFSFSHFPSLSGYQKCYEIVTFFKVQIRIKLIVLIMWKILPFNFDNDPGFFVLTKHERIINKNSKWPNVRFWWRFWCLLKKLWGRCSLKKLNSKLSLSLYMLDMI